MSKLVIFFPGMGGSVLKHAITQKRLYPVKNVKNLLKCESDTTTFSKLMHEAVIPGGPIMSIYNTVVYAKMFETFASKGYRVITECDLNNDKFEPNPRVTYVMGFGWNWTTSHSYSDNVVYLTRIISRWRSRTASKPVVAVGHSSGALVALYYQGLYADSFQKIITIDTPLNGTNEAYQLITWGESNFFPPGLSQKQLWQLTCKLDSNMLYELLTDRHIALLKSSAYSGIDKSKLVRARRFRQLLFKHPSNLIVIIPSSTIFTNDELIPSTSVATTIQLMVEKVDTTKKHSLLLTSNAIIKAICNHINDYTPLSSHNNNPSIK